MLKSKKLLLVSVFLSLGMFFFVPNKASAAACDDFGFTYSGEPPSTVSCDVSTWTPYTVTVTSANNLLIPGQEYTLESSYLGWTELDRKTASSNRSISFTVNSFSAEPGEAYPHKISGPGVGNTGGCSLYSVKVQSGSLSGSVYLSQNRGGQTCWGFPSGCIEAGADLDILVENVKLCGSQYANKNMRVKVTGPELNFTEVERTDGSGNLPVLSRPLSRVGVYDLVVEKTEGINTNLVHRSFTVVAAGTCSECLTTKPTYTTGGVTPQEYKICDQISDSLDGGAAKQSCIDCVGGELGREGIWTAVGCIPRSPEKIVNSLLRIGLGVGGGFSLIIILVSGFILSVSQGEPKRIDEAKQWLTSALVGLLFIIFSVTLLHFIGYTIFRIPGFGG